jgi:tripartite-type tricarboxylate transporter receptor subunit TctC
MARLIARHLPDHIPGSPSIVVENMPGASGLIASSYTFNQAPKDGTVLQMFSETNLRDELLKAEGVQFDARRFNWLGSTQVQTNTCFARTDSGISSMQDVISGGKQLIVGTTGPGSNLHDFPAILKGALNANIKLVPGYPGSSDVTLALESGEVNGACIPWESIKVTRPQWFSGSPPFATVIVQQGAEKHPDLPNVALADQLTQAPELRQLIDAATSTLAISKPLVAPPGVPADRITALRQAFDETMRDPDFLKDAETTKVDLSVKPWDRAMAIAEQVLSTPPNVADRLKSMLESG